MTTATETDYAAIARALDLAESDLERIRARLVAAQEAPCEDMRLALRKAAKAVCAVGECRAAVRRVGRGHGKGEAVSDGD